MTTPHPVLEQAAALLDFERYDQARALLSGRLAEDPGDVRAWVMLGHCHLAAEEPKRALEVSAEALKLAPEDYGALMLRAHAMTRDEGWRTVEPVLREAIRIAPEEPVPRAMLADAVFREAVIQYARTSGVTRLEFSDIDRVSHEAAEIAMEALRLGPGSVYAHEVAQRIASLSGNGTVADQLDEAILRLDPHHHEALARRTEKAAKAPGVHAARATELYADALSSHPDSPQMRQRLDHATYRLLRGTRWLAVLCVVVAGGMINLFPSDDGPVPELPLPIGRRLWCVVVMAAIWGFGAWRRYRKLRAGAQLNVRSLIRRRLWARVVLAQAAWATTCALLIAAPPWSGLGVPRILFWAGLLPTAATLWFDRNRIR
ncbi:tetratricopeptide repeat protein [Streptomyces sp. NPDC006704]|uniref:tetratricopeptide repeat protein n=1 Tax=Streptomyces sp. NPDC006704 TaxID=3364760 RepID=UPI0036D0EA1F